MQPLRLLRRVHAQFVREPATAPFVGGERTGHVPGGRVSAHELAPRILAERVDRQCLGEHRARLCRRLRPTATLVQQDQRLEVMVGDPVPELVRPRGVDSGQDRT